MSPVSILRCTALVLLMGATAQAQTIEEVNWPPQPAPLPLVSRPATEYESRVFDFHWLDISAPPPRYRAWATAEYALMWLNGPSVPPLITSSASVVPAGSAAVLGASTTSTRVGGHDLESNPTSGLRFTAGSWLNSLEDRGFEIGGFFLGSRSTAIGVSGTGLANSVAVGRPIILAETDSEAVLRIAFADRLGGASSASLDTSLWGIDINALARNIPVTATTNIAILAGVRYLDLDQTLAIQDDIRPLGTSEVPLGNLAIGNPNSIRILDSYQTINQFFGGQLGFRTDFETGRLGFGLGFKLGLGATHRTLIINGQTVAFAPNGQPLAAVPGGLLANSANIGRYEHDAFSVVPELDLKLSYRLLDCLYAFVGYDYLLWNQVIMPGGQVSRTVSASNVPASGSFVAGSGAVGATTISQSNLAVNSLTFGFRLTY